MNLVCVITLEGNNEIQLIFDMTNMKFISYLIWQYNLCQENVAVVIRIHKTYSANSEPYVCVCVCVCVYLYVYALCCA